MITSATRPVSRLSLSAADHRKIGSTPPQVLLNNPGKKLHQTMDGNELRAYIAIQFMAISAQYRLASKGDPREIVSLNRARDDMFIPDLLYLKEIGCLPLELADLDPKTVFKLPSIR